MICVHKRKESLSTQFISQLSTFFVVSYSHAESVAVHSSYFLLIEKLFDAKVLPVGHAVTQNYVIVVFQSETTEKKSHDYLIRHVKEKMVMKILEQFRTHVN